MQCVRLTLCCRGLLLTSLMAGDGVEVITLLSGVTLEQYHRHSECTESKQTGLLSTTTTATTTPRFREGIPVRKSSKPTGPNAGTWDESSV